MRSVPIIGFEDKYIIYEDGKVLSLYRNNFMTPKADKDGYFRVGLWDGIKIHNRIIHRLIAIHFIEGRTKERDIVNHKDGNKQNNQISNLEWVTVQENSTHASENGLLKGRKGIKHHNAKLTESDVKEIKYFLENKLLGCRRLGRLYGVNPGTIQKIQWGQRWSHIKI